MMPDKESNAVVHSNVQVRYLLSIELKNGIKSNDVDFIFVYNLGGNS